MRKMRTLLALALLSIFSGACGCSGGKLEEVRTLHGHAGEVLFLAFSHNGKKLASTGTKGPVRLWDVERGEQVRVVESAGKPYHRPLFSPDGTVLAVVRPNLRAVEIWDAGLENMLRRLHVEPATNTGIAFDSEGRLLAVPAGKGGIQIWDVKSGQLVQSLLPTGSVDRGFICAAFSPKGDLVAGGDLDDIVWVWDRPSGRVVHTFNTGHFSLRTIAFARSGTEIISSAMDEYIRIWNVSSERVVRELRLKPTMVFRSFALSTDGTLLAAVYSERGIGGSGELGLWKLETAELITETRAHTRLASAIDFAPGGKYIATGSWDGTIKLWKVPKR